MVLVTGSWRIWLAGMVASLAIFGVLYFTVIKPSSDTANQAVKAGLQQTQQALDQAQKQVSSAAGTSSAVSTAAQKTLSKAEQLTQCLTAAGTDVSKVQSCQSQYGS